MPNENELIQDGNPYSNQKLKIMYLMKILLEYSDENHAITIKDDIIPRLKEYGIKAERKSLYDDIEKLRLYGLDIVMSQYDKTYHYQVNSRQFELPELKMLVDAVQSSKFITEKKSKELISKIEGFASKYQASKLDRQVNVAGRVKTINKRVYYNVDAAHEALSEDKQITFQYFVWNVDKKMELKHDGAYYHVSPWALCWDDEKYYLIGYDNDDMKIKHFRVDKMTNASVVDDKRIGKDEFKRINMSEYTSKMFGMFEGDMEFVKLRCENHLANVMFDRFGIDTPVIKVDDNHFNMTVKVSVSKLFLGWIMALDGVEIVSPESVVTMMKDEILRLYDIYIK